MFVLFVTWIIPECHINMRRVKKTYAKYVVNSAFDAKRLRYPVKDVLFELSCVTSKEGQITLHSDITLLFNQQRLESRMSAVELREYIERYTPNASVYTNKLSDDELLDSLKSKHVQSLSELKAWAEQCIENLDVVADDTLSKLTEFQQSSVNSSSSE